MNHFFGCFHTHWSMLCWNNLLRGSGRGEQNVSKWGMQFCKVAESTMNKAAAGGGKRRRVTAFLSSTLLFCFPSRAPLNYRTAHCCWGRTDWQRQRENDNYLSIISRNLSAQSQSQKLKLSCGGLELKQITVNKVSCSLTCFFKPF